MKLLSDYLFIKEVIHEYFGYVEDWVSIPMEDSREYYWYLEGEAHGDSVLYADTVEQLEDHDGGNYYSDEIYTQRFLKQWVFYGKDYTMVSCDTHVDGNKFLRIFDNSKRVYLDGN